MTGHVEYLRDRAGAQCSNKPKFSDLLNERLKLEMEVICSIVESVRVA